MAVAPTGAIYKALEFDGVSSRTYGVYITGEAVYNAPERDVEMIAIPGRNGSFALDKGRFENIEVSYPAGIFADAESDFAEAVSDFRNFLCSRNGYVRLQDEYNPNEYRMAVYKSGLEVTPAQLKAGEFNIVFECKPQRWLTSGESEITVGEWSEWETESGPIVEIEASETDKIKSLSVALEPIQEGSGTPSPDNVRPISGRTECNTYVSGINVWDEEWEVGAYGTSTGAKVTASNRIRSKNYIRVVSGATYYGEYGGSGSLFAYYYDGDKNYVGLYPDITNKTFTIPSDVEYITISTYGASSETYANDISINYPSTDHDYHAYNGQSYTTDLGRTVYGGTLDVVSGELVVDMAIVDLGTLNWSRYKFGSQYAFYANVSDRKSQSPNIKCAKYPFVVDGPSGMADKTINSTSNSSYIYVRDDAYTDAATFKTAMSGVQLCYELATPQTYQLTPTEVALIKGQNNVWSDGNVTLEYGQDPNVIVNPTLFEASPLLIAEGTGKITVNGTDIRIQNSVVGDCGLCYELNVPGNYYLAGFTNIFIATGDIIDTEDIDYTFAIYNADSSYTFTSQSVTNVTGNPDILPNATDLPGGEVIVVTCALDDEAYSFRTALSKTIGFDVNITNSNGDSATIHVEVTAAYDGNKIIEYSAFVGYVPEAFYLYNPMFQFTAHPSITIHSTAATFGNPTYIDCDIGEAYADLSGTISPLNRYIELGSKLPTLAIGNTEITFDNTIATLKVVPRWWKI